ncbi:DUF4097 family beta strand repeat-containing protein [Peribacillus asahii]|uniref:DUF4097 family beta strand repeat-containing protein n=1 Tax=Peribacillus asahii TaxID=228899 RepID=UPI00382EC95A
MQEEKKRILQLVQDGKITAEEALTILEALDKAGKESEQKEQVLKNELSTEVIEAKKQHYDDAHDTFKKNIQSSKEKIFEFVESAFQKIKDTDLDFNFGKSFTVSHIFQHDEKVIQDLDVDIANGKIKMIAWDHHDVRVECEAKVYRVDDQDQAREAFLNEVIFAIEDGTLKFYLQEKGIKADVLIYVPQKEYKQLRIRMFNGGVAAESLAAEEVKVKSANGSISMDSVRGENCELETGNGTITIQASRFDKVEAETLNGAIEAGGHFKKVDVQTFNGQIICRNDNEESDSLYAKSITGKIQLSVASGAAVSGELKSNLGGFNVNLEGIKIVEEKSDVIQKVLKFQTVYDQTPVLHIFADTKTGAISVS